MNVFTFTGNLGADCTRKTTQGGMAICTFKVAIKSGYGDKAKTTWAECSLFGKKAESALPNFLLKGTKVCVSGEATLDEWESKDGKRFTLRVAVNSLDLLDSKPKAAPEPKNEAPAQPGFTSADFDDDIPF